MSDLNREDEVLESQDEELTLDDILGEDASLEADMELESLDVQEEENDFFIEDISGFAKGFPDWDLLPPTAKVKKTAKK
ncbi:MAG: hypothetical protein K2L61_04015 [Clostridia bacterium]|nr:hypothetical protein [Clostridia bacterium]